MKSQGDLRNMIGELLDLEEGLNGWELQFIEDMDKRRQNYSPGQASKIEQIWDERIGNK